MIIVQYVDELRDRIQRHPETAAASGFVLGILAIIFLRPLAWVGFVLFCLAAVIWINAPEDSESN